MALDSPLERDDTDCVGHINSEMRNDSQFLCRVRLISIGCVAVGLVLLGKLYFVEIVQGTIYSEKAARQYSSPSDELFDRGSIFFEMRDKSRVSAASP